MAQAKLAYVFAFERHTYLGGDGDRRRIVRQDHGAFLGRCGLLPWTIDGQSEVELAYLIDKVSKCQALGFQDDHGISEGRMVRPNV